MILKTPSLALSCLLLWCTSSVRLCGQTNQMEKPPIHGLVTMGALAPMFLKGGHANNLLTEANAHPGVYSGVVIQVSWDELEHVEGTLDASRIDEGLNAVRTYNKRHPETPVKAKLRVYAGWNTPDWVVLKSGGSFTMESKRGPVVVGRFWTAAYRQAWRNLQIMLAARYDDDPLMEEVAVSSCSTMTDEPFIIALNPVNILTLHAAGFSDASYQSCLMGAIDDYSSWKRTAIDFTVNPFRDSDSGRPVNDNRFTIAILEAFRKRYGSRGVIANHGLQPAISDRQEEIASEFRKLGPPIEFQTIAPSLDWDASVALGLKYKATEIEVWNTKDVGGHANVSFDQLKEWAGKMRPSAAH